MNLKAPNGRSDYLFDLTRWNRAGLTRFEYTNGDASVWLEELRIVMLGLYGHGIDPADRTPEKWRDLFMKPLSERKLTTSAVEFETNSVWKDLFTAFPAEIETAGKRNQRLLEQYDRQSPDYAWETMRAFARAAHIVLGHLDAYANEGYLRTATQWENLRKLAAMVNYQPTPPASATTTVALELEADKGVIEIARGLAMKFAPPEGGAPLIFETLKPVLGHSDLNAVRTVGWDYNETSLNLNDKTTWIVPKTAELAQGDLVVITPDIDNACGFATSLKTVTRSEKAEQSTLGFNEFWPEIKSDVNMKTGSVLLLTGPDGIQLGLPRTSGNRKVIKTNNADSYSPGAIVEVSYRKDHVKATAQAVVVEGAKGHLTIEISETIFEEVTGDVTVEAFTPYAVDDEGRLETSVGISTLYYKRSSGTGNPVILENSTSTRTHDNTASGKDVAQTHKRPDKASGWAYARSSGRADKGRVIVTPTVGGDSEGNIVRFEGTPPKSLQQGDWYVARQIGSSVLEPLKVSTIRMEADVYYVKFYKAPKAAHDQTEFFGPMTRTLRPVEYDRDQQDAIIGGEAFLRGVSDKARDLVKVGRDVIVVYEKGAKRRSTLGVLTSVEVQNDLDEKKNKILKITMAVEESFSGWHAGWTKFYLNTVDISQGETKDPKILGSGDAEKRRQVFQFKITDVSFIPSTASVTGVAPDMDVTVDGVKWEFRDLGDPNAEDQDAWSVALNEDDTLQIHFRRRLPTGSNNIAVSRHRVGVGAKGTGVPPWSMTKPMKKNRFVTGVVQPFFTAGGASREPVSDIRVNAPSKLAVNGRAVSLIDFDRLCKRHSSVWQAKAREVVGPGAIHQVDVVIVPANGGVVPSTLKGDLIDFVESKTLPNTRVTITDYQSLNMQMHVRIYVDTSRYEKSDVKDAVEAGLVSEFALINRSLGQPIYVAEILAAMERIDGVSSATITDFSSKSGAPTSLREARVAGSLVALFPTEEQVAVLHSIADVTVDVEVLV